MREVISLLEICAGAFLIGVAATIKFIFWISVRSNDRDNGEGCLGNFIALSFTIFALYLVSSGLSAF